MAEPSTIHVDIVSAEGEGAEEADVVLAEAEGALNRAELRLAVAAGGG